VVDESARVRRYILVSFRVCQYQATTGAEAGGLCNRGLERHRKRPTRKETESVTERTERRTEGSQAESTAEYA
jgi:hypothetical protein